MARMLVLIADGTEEMEFVIPVDMFRRAKWDVVSAGIQKESVIASRGVKLTADTVLARVRPEDFDGIVVPGGSGGVEAMRRDARVA